MSNAFKYAKYFIKNGYDNVRNTYDGNMKLQKLLFFADFINIFKFGEPLFYDPVMAFADGCVIEDVRIHYKTECDKFCVESETDIPDFSMNEIEVLNLTTSIFGKLSGRELSELNHNFNFWKTAYDRSLLEEGYRNKILAVITPEEMMKESDKIDSVIDSFTRNNEISHKSEVINGISFNYDSGNITVNENIYSKLLDFSLNADDLSYFIYIENGELVIY